MTKPMPHTYVDEDGNEYLAIPYGYVKDISILDADNANRPPVHNAYFISEQLGDLLFQHQYKMVYVLKHVGKDPEDRSYSIKTIPFPEFCLSKKSHFSHGRYVLYADIKGYGECVPLDGYGSSWSFDERDVIEHMNKLQGNLK